MQESCFQACCSYLSGSFSDALFFSSLLPGQTHLAGSGLRGRPTLWAAGARTLAAADRGKFAGVGGFPSENGPPLPPPGF